MPVLDLDVNTRRLVELAGGRGGTPALEAAGVDSGQRQIEAPPAQITGAPPAPTPLDFYGPKISACSTQDDLNALWSEINGNRHAFPEVVAALKSQAAHIERASLAVPNPWEVSTPFASPETGEPPTSLFADADQDAAAEHVEGELLPFGAGVDDDLETDRAWQDVLTAAGQRQMTTTEVVNAFEQWAALPVADADAAKFREFIAAELS